MSRSINWKASGQPLHSTSASAPTSPAQPSPPATTTFLKAYTPPPPHSHTCHRPLHFLRVQLPAAVGIHALERPRHSRFFSLHIPARGTAGQCMAQGKGCSNRQNPHAYKPAPQPPPWPPHTCNLASHNTCLVFDVVVAGSIPCSLEVLVPSLARSPSRQGHPRDPSFQHMLISVPLSAHFRLPRTAARRQRSPPHHCYTYLHEKTGAAPTHRLNSSKVTSPSALRSYWLNKSRR